MACGLAATRFQYSPFRARLSDSVPPEVKITSDGWAPAARAICWRASSTTRFAARPAPCREEGLPVRANWAVTACRAAPLSCVVAA